jgi:hypothetical protein
VLDLEGPTNRTQCFAVLEKAISPDQMLGPLRLDFNRKLK